jgi:flagellar hook-length control protein FliK
MTGASGIASTAAAPIGGAKAKLPEVAPDEAARSDTSEFAAFAELFSYIESEEAPAGEAAPDKADEKPADDGDKDTPPPILLAEMMHYQWFGAQLASPAPDAGAPQGGAASAEHSEGEGGPADASAPDQSPLNLDLPRPVRELVAMSAQMRSPEAVALAAASAAQKKAALPPAPSLPGESAEPLQASLTAPLAPPALVSSPEPAVSAAPKPAEALPLPQPAQPLVSAPASEPRPPEPISADAKASLLALETVLSRSGPMAKETGERSGEGQLSAPPFKEVRISAIQKETHFAPAMPQPPIVQIASRIDQDMRSAAVQNVQQPVTDPRAEAAPVHTLHIQLDPPQLGPLTIRISLKDGAINLQLETARHETAALIQTDKDELSGLLRSAGYVVDGLNVQVAGTSPDRLTPQQQFQGGGGAGGFNQAMGQQPGWRQPDGRPTDRAGAAGGPEDTSAGSSHETQGPDAAKPRGGSLYL